ncbi:MAG: hypothetical protein L6Q76_34125, partial [Polyangiaceae bacterium]|nr:hypothetical protein [Polyangiaceae bacterium]
MSSLKLPLCIALRPSAVERRDGITVLVMRTFRPATADEGLAVYAFELKNDERAFARELLGRKSNYWLFRSNQRRACGDFVVVDVSSPHPARRRAFVIDLKQGAPVRVGGGGAGVQLRNAESAVSELRSAGVLGVDAPFSV